MASFSLYSRVVLPAASRPTAATHTHKNMHRHSTVTLTVYSVTNRTATKDCSIKIPCFVRHALQKSRISSLQRVIKYTVI